MEKKVHQQLLCIFHDKRWEPLKERKTTYLKIYQHIFKDISTYIKKCQHIYLHIFKRYINIYLKGISTYISGQHMETIYSKIYQHIFQGNRWKRLEAREWRIWIRLAGSTSSQAANNRLLGGDNFFEYGGANIFEDV